MTRSSPPFKGSKVKAAIGHSCGRICTALGLVWCTTLSLAAPETGAVSAAAITSISLQRDCSACANGSLLVLQRDGSAHYTVTGHARHGTSDQTSQGRVSPQDFDALARLAVAQGFFALQDSYEDPQLQDGGWTALRISGAGFDKQVFNRNDAGPASLQTLERGVDALKTRIKFAPALR
jgi:hypothetical protein